ncbi:hypothetical protein GIB67_014043 [Kingdonia uniflora]|uniref:Uncharacterized protein n=1 Tax=Kingdonia uniflora TaxID=39325 RepID=A0A7J7KXJ1_9MAGN|nr:hypothetical protein GIB67_014043 [Kingdonia uniflora]
MYTGKRCDFIVSLLTADFVSSTQRSRKILALEVEGLGVSEQFEPQILDSFIQKCKVEFLTPESLGGCNRGCMAKLDKHEKLFDFVNKLETACVETVETGKMTKDLALLIHGSKVKREAYLSTEEFIDTVAQNLEAKLRVPVSV